MPAMLSERNENCAPFSHQFAIGRSRKLPVVYEIHKLMGFMFISSRCCAFSGRLRTERPHPDCPRRPREPLRCHARLRHQAGGATVPEGHPYRRAGERSRRRVGLNFQQNSSSMSPVVLIGWNWLCEPSADPNPASCPVTSSTFAS